MLRPSEVNFGVVECKCCCKDHVPTECLISGSALACSAYVGRWGNPLFSVHDNLSPVVTVEQNFDRSAASPLIG